MIDFWEALGRLAYDKDLFDEFQEVLGPPNPRLMPSENVTVKSVTATVLNIPEDVYKRVQGFLSPILTEQYVSLFVAGELFWAFSRQETRNAFVKLHESISRVKLHNPSTSYFITLGLILVDKLFRAEVANSGKNRVQVLPRLSQRQRDQLGMLVEDPAFLANVAAFEFPWDEGCFEWLIYRRGYVHPLAVDATKQTLEAKGGPY